MNKGCKKLIDLEKKIGQGSGGIMFVNEIQDPDDYTILKLDKTFSEMFESRNSNLIVIRSIVPGDIPGIGGTIYYFVCDIEITPGKGSDIDYIIDAISKNSNIQYSAQGIDEYPARSYTNL